MNLFPIDFVRQVLEQTLEEQHNLYPKKFFGGKDQVNLFSFYEQLEKQEQVDRYVEMYRDLSDQQNRTGLIMNGTIIAPENPTITNIYSALIIPMAFTCSFRVKLEDRDMALETINNLIEQLKGKKQDVALLNNGQLFKVGTLGNGNGVPKVHSGDYIGDYTTSGSTLSEQIIAFLESLGSSWDREIITGQQFYQYASISGVIKVVMDMGLGATPTWQVVSDSDQYKDIIFPPQHSSFTKFKLSLSFDSLRCDQPYNLNSDEYCTISFGGSATLVSNGVKLGNDMIKVSFTKKKIVADPVITISDTAHWLEPLEMPSGNNADTKVSNLISNNFISNSHTNSLALSLQYTFILNENENLLEQWFNYSRYGVQADGSTITYANGITPNMIYEINELWSTWGVVKSKTFNAKIVESMDIEETESDVLTITIPLQLQGANN